MDSKKKEYNKYFKEYIDLVVEIFELSIFDGCECDTSPYPWINGVVKKIDFSETLGKNQPNYDSSVMRLCRKYLVKPAIILAADRYAANKSGIERQFSKNITLSNGKTIDTFISEEHKWRKKDFETAFEIDGVNVKTL